MWKIFNIESLIIEFKNENIVTIGMSSFSVSESSPGSSVGNDAGCQSRGCEFESRLGQLSFRRLTNVIATCVIRLPPMG